MFLLFVQICLLGVTDDDSKLPAKLRLFIGKIATVAQRISWCVCGKHNLIAPWHADAGALVTAFF